MLSSKPTRARTILETVFALNDAAGAAHPSSGHGAATRGRRISPTGEPWYAQLNPDRRMTVGRVFRNQVGDRLVEAPGWMCVSIFFRGQTRLVANVREDELEIHYFMPGLWEGWFGADPGSDSQTYSRLPFGDARSPEWQLMVASEDYKLPPLRDGGPHPEQC